MMYATGACFSDASRAWVSVNSTVHSALPALPLLPPQVVSSGVHPWVARQVVKGVMTLLAGKPPEVHCAVQSIRGQLPDTSVQDYPIQVYMPHWERATSNPYRFSHNQLCLITTSMLPFPVCFPGCSGCDGPGFGLAWGCEARPVESLVATSGLPCLFVPALSHSCPGRSTGASRTTATSCQWRWLGC